jgi:hypothetical protein
MRRSLPDAPQRNKISDAAHTQCRIWPDAPYPGHQMRRIWNRIQRIWSRMRRVSSQMRHILDQMRRIRQKSTQI